MAACGGSSPPPAEDPKPGSEADAKAAYCADLAASRPPPTEPALAADATEIERRQAAACHTLGPKLTACAQADACAEMSLADLRALGLEELGPAHTQQFVDSCVAQTLSSRQVRVYEVCQREESECEPLLACLENAETP